MNNIIKRVWNQNRLVNIEDLTGMAFQAEADGHTFEISGIDDTGAAVELSGTVSGVFRRPDNADIALTGSASDGVVSVTLSEDCYAVPGRFGLTIFVTSNSQKVAVYACVGTVAVSSTGNVAGDTPANVEDLLDAIDGAIASIPADYTDLLAAIAPTFSSTALYAIGSYTWYDGVLYRFTANKEAGAWNNNKVTPVSLANDVTQESNDLKTNYAIALGTWEQGSFVTWNKRISNRYDIPIQAGDIVKYDSGSLQIWLGIYEDGATGSSYVKTWHVEHNGVYKCAVSGRLTVLFKKADGSVMSLSDYDATVKIYNTKYGRNVVNIDEAKTFELETNARIGTAFDFEWEQGSIDANGNNTADTARIRTTAMMPMPDVLHIDITNNNPTKKYMVKQYDDFGGIVHDSRWITESGNIDQKYCATQFRIVLAFTSNATINTSDASSIFAYPVINGLAFDVDEVRNEVFKEYKYLYNGERFQSRVKGFNASKLLNISYGSNETLNSICVYGDYLVCGISPARIQVYSIATRSKVADMYVQKGGVQQSEHFANMTISDTFYDNGDLLPLIYAEVETDGLYDVIRVSDANTANVVKQYKFTAETSGNNPQVVFDFANGIGYGLNRFDTTNKLVKYDLQNETENQDGTFSFDVLSTGDCPNLRTRQGACIHGDRIYMLTTRATSSPYETKVIGLDCTENDAHLVSEMSDLPFTSEGEGIAILVRGSTAYMLVTDYFNIYVLSF